MGGAIKSFIVINFLLSIGVVVMGYLVFKDREVIKARTLLLEQNAARIAENLDWGETVDWETADERKLTAYSVAQPVLPEELPTLEGNLDDLARFATTRVAQLNQRYAELVQTQQELADTRDTLATRERELAQTRQELADTKDTLAATQEELRDANRQIDQLNLEKSNLERQIESLNTEIEGLNNTIAGLEVDLQAMTDQFDRLQEKYDTLVGNLNNDGPKDAGAWKGRSGVVLSVNQEWNYVVIDKGEVDDLLLYLDALVHRGDQFIGKLTVVRVEDTVAIAEIQNDTMAEGESIVPGDTFFF